MATISRMQTTAPRATQQKSEIEYPEGLQKLLEEILGSRNVYFQPPSDKKISYPAIIYELDNIDSRFGDNVPYFHYPRYTVKYIDKMPDMTIPNKIGALPMCRFSRYYTTEDFNHYSYLLYYKEAKKNG